MVIKTVEHPNLSQKCWEFKLTYKNGKSIKTFVYSDTGKDIEQRFIPHKVSNIKEIKDPNADVATTDSGWRK